VSGVLGIEKIIWLSAGTYIFDSAASLLGIPTVPSYIPNAMTSFTDRMSFMDRVNNWILNMIMIGTAKLPIGFMKAEEDSFQAVVADENRRVAPSATGKTLNDLAIERIMTLYVNGEEVLDYPRPFLPGMIFLGQLDHHTNISELDEKWKNMTSAKDGVIMFSLGTVANTSTMPMAMKTAFLDAFKQFPTYTIIWRLEGEAPAGTEEQKHIKIVKWLPQRDLLYRGNVKLFITHGGYNSLVETAQAGVPMLLLPLFGDQQGNAKRAVRLGIGLDLKKTELDVHTIAQKMKTILSDEKYSKNSAKLAKFMADSLIENEDVAVQQVEKLVKTRRWPISRARNLNYAQLLCLDVISVAALLVISSIFLACKFVRFLIKNFRG